MALIECRECKNQVSDSAKACPKCGAPVADPVPSKSRGISILLALFLGGIGAHKFYLERPLQGILYLVFCWTFIPAIIALIEALNFAFMSQRTFAERYCS